ncbi:uncharacterized protein Tco025E_04412 [Trypanosoma conorhini]|uniref:Uncharacterized protein n=1 Tax=Trypanosoma conorhini TaxID=83891 RepID=A0A3R7S0N0_9TRYP|nr:uncharacterized protein Tco025E_04412 [Trypanosoma conorhini]RNF18614.1 hypothetical protein Tco025E_04412 [Trypanosoma conorhini]
MCSTGAGLTPQQEAAYDRRLREAQAAKQKGNELLAGLEGEEGTPDANKRLREAAFCYRCGCMHLAEYLPATTEEAEGSLQDMLVNRQARARRCPLDAGRLTKVAELYAALQNNLTLVNSRLGRYVEAVACATAVLAVPGHAGDKKALLRRASCNCALKNFAAAENDLDVLERLFREEGVQPDCLVPELRGQILSARREALEKERSMCKKMFT